MDELAYHYCSIETLYSMINNKKLWLSDADFMNDKYEITWIDNIINQIFIEMKKENIKGINVDKLKEEYNLLKHKTLHNVFFKKIRFIKPMERVW